MKIPKKPKSYWRAIQRRVDKFEELVGRECGHHDAIARSMDAKVVLMETIVDAIFKANDAGLAGKRMERVNEC